MLNFVSTSIPTTFAEQVRTALVNNPNTNYVVVPFDAAATFAVQGVRAAAMANKVKVVSTGGNLSNLALIKSNNVQTETSAEPLEYFSWLAVDALVRAQAGAPQITFAAPIKVLVSQNLPAPGQAWTGDSDFRSAFLANWGR
jgi:ABC-type sugar transport system substrate-binding protein